jgi:hypothetical protein
MELPIYELMINEDMQDDAEVSFIALVDKPAIQRNWNAFKENVKFQIVSEDKQIISGPAMLADTPIYRNDIHNGEYYVVFSKDTIYKIVKKWFRKGYQSNFNLMHDSEQQVDGVTMFESFISDKERGIQPMKGFEDAPDGSWFVSLSVDNEDVWTDIKEGKFKGLSVEGLFEYGNIKSKKKDTEIMQKILEILSEVDFGGPGSGRKPEGGTTDDSNGGNLQNIGNNINNGNFPSEDELDKLSETNPKAELVIREMINWKNGIYNPNYTLNDETKQIFDKLKTKKDYPLYRIDPTLDLKNITIGNEIKFDNKPTYVSSNKDFVKSMGSLGNKNKPILIFDKGTKSLNLNKGDNRGEELIRGTYKVKEIKGNEIYISEN